MYYGGLLKADRAGMTAFELKISWQDFSARQREKRCGGL